MIGLLGLSMQGSLQETWMMGKRATTVIRGLRSGWATGSCLIWTECAGCPGPGSSVGP